MATINLPQISRPEPLRPAPRSKDFSGAASLASAQTQALGAALDFGTAIAKLAAGDGQAEYNEALVKYKTAEMEKMAELQTAPLDAVGDAETGTSHDVINKQTFMKSLPNTSEIRKWRKEYLDNELLPSMKSKQAKEGLRLKVEADAIETDKKVIDFDYKRNKARLADSYAEKANMFMASGDREEFRGTILEANKIGIYDSQEADDLLDTGFALMHQSDLVNAAMQASFSRKGMGEETLGKAIINNNLTYKTYNGEEKTLDGGAVVKEFKDKFDAQRKVFKERETVLDAAYLQKFFGEDKSFTKDFILQDRQTEEFPDVKEKYLKMLEQRDKAERSGDKDPNKITDPLVYAAVIKAVNNPDLTDNQKTQIVIGAIGADKNGNPGISGTDGESLIKAVGEKKVNAGMIQANDFVKNYFARKRADTRKDDKKIEFDRQEGEILLELQRRVTGDMTSDEIQALANNLIEPVKIKNFKDDLKLHGFMDSFGVDDNEKTQQAIQDNKLYGVTDKYKDQLTTLHKNQIKEIEKLTGKTITAKQTRIEPSGQLIITDPAGNEYKMSVVNNDEAIEVKKKGSDKWEIVK